MATGLQLAVGWYESGPLCSVGRVLQRKVRKGTREKKPSVSLAPGSPLVPQMQPHPQRRIIRHRPAPAAGASFMRGRGREGGDAKKEMGRKIGKEKSRGCSSRDTLELRLRGNCEKK